MADTTLTILINAVDNASKELGAVADKLQPLESSLKKVALVSGAAFAGLSAGIIKTVSDFGAFNSEIQRTGAFVNASVEELKMLKQSAIDAAEGTKFSFVEVAEALGNFVGGEIDATTASQELGNIIDLALVAKLDDLQKAVNMGDLALTVFKNDGMEMSDVIDIIATVASDVTTQTDAWSTALVNSAGAAKAAGFSFKDLNIMFSEMVRGGADVNLIWSAFNAAMVRIQAPTTQTADALAAVGLSADGLKKSLESGPISMLDFLREGFEKANQTGEGFGWLVAVLGRQAAPEFALALGLTNDELVETAGYFDDISGRGKEMTDKIRDAIPPFDQLKQKLSEFSITIGGALEPAISSIVKALNPVIDKLAEFISKHPNLVAVVILVVTALIGLVAVLATVGIAIIGLTTFFATIMPFILAFGVAIAGLSLPVLLIIAGIAALIAIGVAVVMNWDWIKAKATEIWDAIVLKLTTVWTKIQTKATEIWTGIKKYFTDIFVWLGGEWDKIIKKLGDTWDALWGAIAGKVTSVFEAVKNIIKSSINFIIAKINSVIDSINAVAQKIANVVKATAPQIPDIPYLAEGGVVMKPTLAMIGEAGPEAVVPLSRGMAGAGLGGGLTINNYISNNTLLDEFSAEKIGNYLINVVKGNLKI